MENTYSYWEKSTFFNYDVIVIGSGIVGLNAAIHLKKTHSNLKICVLESGFLPSGASTKNAGFACFGSISELIEQEKILGMNGLYSLIEKRWKGLLKLRSVLGDEKMDYQKHGGSEIFKKGEAGLSAECVSKIEHYNRLLKNIVGINAFYLRNEHIDKFGFKGVDQLIFNQYEAQIDSGKMMYALMQYAEQLGITIFNSCRVNRIENETVDVRLDTGQGVFKGNKIVVATNAFVKTLLPDIDISPGRGQVLVTKPIDGLKIKGTFHYDKGFYYFRNIHNRILLGGGRNLDFNAETTTAFGQTEQIQSALENLLKTVILPGIPFEIEQRWSGIMSFGQSIEPIIQETKPNIFCATRCNGMGIAIGTQTGEDVAEMLMSTL